MTKFKFILFQTENVSSRPFEFDENGGKFSKRVENTVGKGKGAIARCKNQGFLGKIVSRMTKFKSKLFQTERVSGLHFEFDKNGGQFSKGSKTSWEKEQLLVTSNFSFSHSVFKRIVLQTRKNQGLLGKSLSQMTKFKS